MILTAGEDGRVVAECPLIPGCVSEGLDRDGALANVGEAIKLCLENQDQEGWSVPSSFEILEIEID